MVRLLVLCLIAGQAGAWVLPGGSLGGLALPGLRGRAPLSLAPGRGRCAAAGGGSARAAGARLGAAGLVASGAFSSGGAVHVYDCTLTQRQVDLSPEDKLRVADRLVDFGVSYVEGGWPAALPRDRSFFERARKELSSAKMQKLVAMVALQDIDASNLEVDEAVGHVLGCGAGAVGVAVAGDASSLGAVVSHLKSKAEGGAVFVQVHDFFETFRADAGAALATVKAAAEAGAAVVTLVDPSGGVTPWEMQECVQKAVAASKGAIIGAACHDDAELAVAGTLCAVRAGAGLVQGTINGFEKSANLASVIPVLQLKMKREAVPGGSLAGLTSLSRFLDEQMNQPHRASQPFVGNSAFAHKGGIHVAAVLKNEDTYQHINPKLVGNQRRVLISELSGRGNIMSKVEEFGMLGQSGGNIKGDPEWKERSGAILKTVKELEQKGYTFEGADASVDLMIRRSMPAYKPPFQIVEYSVHNEDECPTASRIERWKGGAAGDYSAKDRKTAKCKAVVGVRVGQAIDCAIDFDESDNIMDLCDLEDETMRLEVARGNGPVDALAKALKKALLPTYPGLEALELRDYKVRILDAESATGAMVRVMIEFQLTGAAAALHHAAREGKAVKGTTSTNRVTWTTVSAGTNIITASFSALVDGYEYLLAESSNAVSA